MKHHNSLICHNCGQVVPYTVEAREYESDDLRFTEIIIIPEGNPTHINSEAVKETE